MKPVILVAHGTRSVAGRASVQALRDEVAARLAPTPVSLAYVDVQTPTLTEAIAQAQTPPLLVPLFLSAGLHVREDVPLGAVLRSGTALLPWLGSWPETLELFAGLARELTPHGSGRPVLLAAAGSSSASARAEVATFGAHLAQHLDREVLVGFLGGPGPSAADLAGQAGLLVGYLTAPGHFADRANALAAAHGIPVTAPLLADAARSRTLADVIAQRCADAQRACG